MSTPPLCILPEIHLDNTLGVAFLGNIVAAVLYGITTLQTYIYFDHRWDGLILSSLVLFLWLVDTAHIALMTQTLYYYAVTNFMNPLVIMKVTKTIMTVVLLTGISDLAVRGVFAYRIWKLSEKVLWLVVAIAIPSLLTFGCSLAFTIRGMSLGTYINFHRISWILYMAFGTGVAADVIIAASMCFLLRRRRTGFRRTDSMVRMLMVYSINTGALTSMCAICVLIMYATMPNNFIFIAFYFILPKLFLNSLMATLNAREKLREQASGGIVSMPLSTNISSPITPTKSDLSGRTTKPMLEIQVETSTDRKTELPHFSSRGIWSGRYDHRSTQDFDSRFTRSGDTSYSKA